MIQHLCDVCGGIMPQGQERTLEGESGRDYPRHNQTIIVKAEAHLDNQDPAMTSICRNCIIDAVKALDTRPTVSSIEVN